MTRNTPRGTAARTLMTFSPALLGAAVVVGLVGVPQTSEAAAGEVVTAPVTATATAKTDCLTDDLTGTLIEVPGPAGAAVREAVLQLTNTSGRTCQVQGWAEVALVTPPGEVLDIPTRMIGAAASVIDLQPETSTWSRIEWDTCTDGSAGCGTGVALQFIVDPAAAGSVADLTGDAPQDLSMAAMRVGPFQITRDASPL